MAVDEDGFFGLVVTNPPQNEWRKLQGFTLHYVGTKINGLGFDTVLFQLRFQERRHTKNVIAVNRVSGYACVSQDQDLPMLSEEVDTSLPRDLNGASEALDKVILVRVDKVEKFTRGCHDLDRNELDQVLLVVQTE